MRRVMSARQWQGRKANRNEPGSLEMKQQRLQRKHLLLQADNNFCRLDSLQQPVATESSQSTARLRIQYRQQQDQYLEGAQYSTAGQRV